MRANRLYVQQDLTLLQELKLTGETLHYALNVLRLNKNSSLILFNGDGNEYLCEVISLNKKFLHVKIIEQKNVANASSLEVDIYLGISKSSHMDYAIQKTVEAGVKNIFPVMTDRSVTKPSSKSLTNKNNHWQKIVISACEQCGRTELPTLHTVQDITDITTLNANEVGFLLDSKADQSLSEFTGEKLNTVKFVIGAEGGLSNTEIKSIKEKGFQAITLGPRILRTETAAVSAVICAQLLWGDLAQ